MACQQAGRKGFYFFGRFFAKYLNLLRSFALFTVSSLPGNSPGPPTFGESKLSQSWPVITIFLT